MNATNPIRMMYWILTVLTFAAVITMVFTYTPVEQSMGMV
jgi:hypothetical protein